jgi:hypothetical protein
MRNPWKLSTLALTAMLVTVLGRGASISGADADAQPKMHAALNSLRAAKQSLEQATSDKGGHRVKAIQLTKDAIEQVERGIKFDNRN